VRRASIVRHMGIRWRWLQPLMCVPYVPTLGPMHPAAVTVGLFADVIEVAGTGRFLSHDKDRRWAGRRTTRCSPGPSPRNLAWFSCRR
jgi:hypothetical protein